MEIRQLEYFQAVSQLKSITKAADQLHIAQPSVSIAIQKLEDELGVQLFDRSQRQITLTAEGLIFSQRVNEILSRIDDSIKEMKDLKLLQHGTIKIGVPPMIGLSLFPHIFAQFQKQYPQLKLTAVEGGSLAIQNLVDHGKLDIGIITSTSTNTPLSLDTLPITEGQIHVCLHPDHPLCKLNSIPFNQLANQPFILFNRDTFNRQVILEECKKHLITPQIIFSSSQIETIVSLVELEIGISFLFDEIARKYSRIRSFPLADPIKYQIILTWNRSRYRSNAVKAFIDFMAGEYSNP
jgi:DNA-binding transcriptional LysR family regulator